LGELKAICGDNEDLFAQLRKEIAKKCSKEEFAQIVERCNDLEEKSEVLDQRQKDDAAKNEMNHLNMVMATDSNSAAIGAINDAEIPKIWDAIKILQAGAGPTQTIVQGEKVDLSGLGEIYASKKEPELTIVRIEELEKQMSDLTKKYNANVGEVGIDLDAYTKNGGDSNGQDLATRVKNLEAGQIIQDNKIHSL